MAKIVVPNVRQESTVLMHTALKDSGVSIDWTTISNIRAYMYSDAQRVIAGECTVAVDGEDTEILNVTYPATRPQFLGVNSLLVRCTYQGRQKSFDVPVLCFVRSSMQAVGVTEVMEDPELEVTLTTDISTALIDGAIAAALDAAIQASEAKDAALAAAELAAEKAGAASDAADLANGKAALVQERLDTADADHTRAGEDHDRAVQDHGTAGDDHTLAVSDHGTAGEDHTRAGEDHTTAGNDHTRAGEDHTTAGNDHTRAGEDHTQAGEDHTQAGNDHTRAGEDHTTAGNDHTRAGEDHTLAAADHVTAASDHVTWAGYRVVVKSVGSSAPGSPSSGDKWYKTSDNKIYTYDGSAWDSGVAATTGATVVNSVTNDVYVFNGSGLDNFKDEISQLNQKSAPIYECTPEPLFLNSSNVFTGSGTPGCYFLPIAGKLKYNIVAAAGVTTAFAFLKTIPTDAGESADYATGTSRTAIAGGATKSGDVPADANWMYVPKKDSAGANKALASIVFDDYDYVLGVPGTLLELKSGVASIPAQIKANNNNILVRSLPTDHKIEFEVAASSYSYQQLPITIPAGTEVTIKVETLTAASGSTQEIFGKTDLSDSGAFSFGVPTQGATITRTTNRALNYIRVFSSPLAALESYKIVIRYGKKKLVCCWGSSSVLGSYGGYDKYQEAIREEVDAADAPMSFPKMLAGLLGIEYEVWNCGIGGEGMSSILARLGAIPFYNTHAFTLPGDGSWVEIANNSAEKYLKSVFDDSIVVPSTNDQQTSYNYHAMTNPVVVNGIECTLELTGENVTKSAGANVFNNGAYRLKRNVAAASDETVEAGTIFTPRAFKKFSEDNDVIHIYLVGANGGWYSTEDFKNKMDRAIRMLGRKFLVLGYHTALMYGNSAYSEAQREEFDIDIPSADDFRAWQKKEYGCNFLDLRYLMSRRWFIDFAEEFGITIKYKETDDTSIIPQAYQSLLEAMPSSWVEYGLKSDIEAYNLEQPATSLMADGVPAGSTGSHANYYGYKVMGSYICKKLRELGFVK